MKKSMIRIVTILYRKSQSYLSVALSKYNLTTAEQPFFAALQVYDGTTQDELSALIGVDKSATARTVKLLEGKGYVKRVQDETNRRQNRVFITDTARRLWLSVEHELIHFNELLTQHIDADNLEITYNTLLQMEKNVIYLSINKKTAVEQERARYGNENRRRK
ncbi:MAG: MarR family winged helix-turn-helix transcriptional regulator [Synergistaceae bacterium]|jgi:DNA-binding MarR family transcriptional regulator|nr:MarR family winged helix-turn-helix transcriptional regulator [Synergistaceae bacterium]